MPAGLLRPGSRHLCPVRLGYGHRGKLCPTICPSRAPWCGPGSGGSSLFAVEHSAAGYTLHQFALPNFGLEPIHSRLLSGVSEDTFSVFDCDGEGRFFYANGLLMTGSVQDSSLSVVQAGGSMVSGVSLFGSDAPRHPGGSRGQAAVCGQRRLPGAVGGNPSRGHSPPVPGGGKLPGSHRRPPLPLGRREPVPRGERSLSQRPASAPWTRRGGWFTAAATRCSGRPSLGRSWPKPSPGVNCWRCAAVAPLTAEDGFFWFTPLSFQEAAATAYALPHGGGQLPRPVRSQRLPLPLRRSPPRNPRLPKSQRLSPTETPGPTPDPTPSQEPTPQPAADTGGHCPGRRPCW